MQALSQETDTEASTTAEMTFRIDAIRLCSLLLTVACAARAGKTPAMAVAPAPAPAPGGVFDITKLGASGDGKTDSTKALLQAWTSACGGAGKQTILIPSGDYLVGALNFTGPCNGGVTVQLDGNLLASTDLSRFPANWIEIARVDNLVVTGAGTLDGRGAAAWRRNDCATSYDCKVLPNTLVLDFVNNSEVSGITLRDAKFKHVNIFGCRGVTVRDVTVAAPAASPNTDGIHVGDSANITVANATIGTGDDCVSVGPGASGVTITGVTCGPGHGISIGSLGRYRDEKDVTDIAVTNCTLKNTTNGVRIKAYDGAAAALTVSKVRYEGIRMEDVANPIIIDMKYCPNGICKSNGGAKVAVRDVTFQNIAGSSSTPEVVSFLCSDELPCTGIQMLNVNVEYEGTDNKTMAVCNNAQGTASGCPKELACLRTPPFVI
ncbi:hypothetical protein ACP70R_044196 [Stipagrostis hirtigluma subsp. patula]